MPAALPSGYGGYRYEAGEQKGITVRYTNECKQPKKKGEAQSRAQKETKSLKFKGGRGGDFRIGSRDILSTPEILSPFDYEEETPKSRRGKKNQLTPAEEKPVAPTHNRKSKKKTEEPASEIKVTRAKADKAPAKADKAPAKKTAKKTATKKSAAKKSTAKKPAAKKTTAQKSKEAQK